MRFLATILAAALAVAGLSSPASAAYPDVPVTFIRDGNVWLTTGGVAHQITESGSASWPRLSPGNREIAFVHDGDIWIAEVSTAPVSASAMRRLTSDAQAGGPAWSPDGASIAYRSGDAHTGTLHIVPADGSNERLWPSENWSPLETATSVAWSADGRFVAYPGGNCGSINDDCLTVLDLRSGKERTAASYGGGGIELSGYATTPAFSPDSRYLYFTQQTGLLSAGPLQIIEFDREKRSGRQVGIDGDSCPAPLGDGRLVVSNGGNLFYLQPGGRRSVLGAGTQPHAAY